MAQITHLLQTILENTSVQPTHVVYGEGNQEYQIRHGQTGKFWKTYGTLVDEKAGKVQLALGEIIGAESPLVLDLEIALDKSLRFPEISSLCDHPLWELIYEFVATVQQLLVDLVDDMPEPARWAVLLHTPREYQQAQRFRWLYRLHFPLCHLDTDWQHNVFLPQLLSVCRQIRVGAQERLLFECLPDGFRVCADWADAIQLPRDSLPLYRSRKSQLRPELEYALVFSDISNLDEDDEAPELDPRTAFPIVRHLHFDTGQCKPQEVYVKGNVSLNHTLAFVLSQSYAPSSHYQPKKSGTASRILSPSASVWDTRLSTSSHTTPYQAVTESLLPLLAPERFQKEHTWMDIGRALYVTYNRGPRGLWWWQKYTAMHSRGAFTALDCTKQYNDCLCDVTLLTYRTIGFYARDDSPDAYKTWHRAWCENDLKVLYEEDKTTHADVSALLYKRYWLEFVYERGEWYEYLPAEYGWRKSYKKDAVARRVTNDFIPFVYELRHELTTQQVCASPDKKGDFDKPLNAMRRLIEKLKDDSFCSQTITQAQTRCPYDDEGFTSKTFGMRLDTNPNLIRVQNGVLEVVGKHVVFRKGKPEDYLTMMAGIQYEEHYTWDTPEVKAFLYWMKQIFEESDVIDYCMRIFASILRGRNKDKILPIWWGDQGNNAKSTLMDCCKLALGNYHIELPTSVATAGRGNAGAATPELMMLSRAHMACMKEPDPNERLQVGKLKELTGNTDNVYMRALYGEGGESKIMSKIFLHCNEVPPTNSPNDKAMVNRVVIIPFQSVWSADAPDTLEEQRKLRIYKTDSDFELNLKMYARAWLWLAVQYYPLYAEKGVSTLPDTVRNATNAYWDKINYYNNFRNELLEADPQGCVTVTEMYQPFLDFLEQDYQKKTNRPPKSAFREGIKKALAHAEFKKDTFHGWRLKLTFN